MSINQVVEALENYVTTIATAGGGDKQLFMAAIRQADDKARAALATFRAAVSARQLSEQPGFVMVPVGDMAEIKEALDICVSLLESAKSNHLPRIIAAYSKADAIVKPETCDCPAKDMPFGRCCKVTPSAPTAVEPDERATCEWTLEDDDNGTWQSSCGELWSFIEGGPKENRVSFCHNCGKPAIVRASKGTPL